MKRSLSLHLALSYLIVILIGMGIAIPLAWLSVERLYLSTQRENLLAQARLAAAALSSTAPESANPAPYSQSSNLLPGIHTRVIDPQGAVVIDLASQDGSQPTTGLALPALAQSKNGLVTPQDLLSRPEIALALQGQPGTAIRRVEAAGGGRVLYAAVPVLNPEGAVLQIVYLATPLPDTGWSALPVTVRWQLAAVILAAILLSGIAGLVLSRRISKPLEQLALAARGVAAGDLNQAVPEEAKITELSTLGKSFNAMTSSLRHADQAKTAFISDVSHELRTPLTVIKGTIETLQDGALDDLSGRGALLSSMGRETERLIKLVNDLLVLTRLDAGALNLQTSELELSELVRSRCEHLERAANLRQVRLAPVIGAGKDAAESYRVWGDPDRIAQVLDNLLDNAIRYSPAGCEVRVGITREANMVACHVTDVGPGIPPEYLPFVFERFYRANTSRERSQGGSGLGLSIVRSLVQAQGGSTGIQSVEGQGTTVTFRLPAAATSQELPSN